MNRPTTIYALIDPNTNECRYVGKSVDPSMRYSSHCKATGAGHTPNWIKSLLPLKPIMVELEVVIGNWAKSEQFWISYMRFLGARLTNLTLGGEGVHGHSPSKETRAKMVYAATHRSAEYLAKNAASHIGKSHSVEVLAKISASSAARRHSEESRAKMSISRTGKIPSAETRAKMSLAQRGQLKSEAHRVKMSKSAKIRCSKQYYSEQQLMLF